MQTKLFDKIGETVYTDTLPNGLKINVLPKRGFNKSYAVFMTDYGGADRRFFIDGKWIDTPAGVAHFLEHKMFDMPDGENALAILSANGASPNAYTSSSETAYYFESTEGFEENLRTLLSFVSTPYFTEESVAKEQGIIGQEIKMVEDNPDFAVYINAMKCLYQNNPVKDSVAGTVESIAEISAQTLYDCHKIFYNPSNMTLAVVGDVDPEKVKEIALEILPKEAGEVPQRDYGEPESETPHSFSKEVNMEVSAPQFLLGSRFKPAPLGTAKHKQELIGGLALRCLIGRASPFYTELYAEGLLDKDFGGEISYSAKSAVFMAGGESREPKTILERFKKAVENADNMEEEVFERNKKAYFGGSLRALDSFESLCYVLAESALEGYEPFEGYDLIEEITFADVKEFIKTVLNPEKLILSVVNPTNANIETEIDSDD